MDRVWPGNMLNLPVYNVPILLPNRHGPGLMAMNDCFFCKGFGTAKKFLFRRTTNKGKPRLEYFLVECPFCQGKEDPNMQSPGMETL